MNEGAGGQNKRGPGPDTRTDQSFLGITAWTLSHPTGQATVSPVLQRQRSVGDAVSADPAPLLRSAVIAPDCFPGDLLSPTSQDPGGAAIKGSSHPPTGGHDKGEPQLLWGI